MTTLPNTVPADHPELAKRVAEQVDADGYSVVTGLLPRDVCEALVAEVDRVEREHEIGFGENEFEGFQTRRIFNLVARGPAFRELVIQPRMLEIVEGLLGEGFLLSGTTSMHIGPGETPQLLHADDGMITLPRPHPATMITTLWALSDFSPDNGGTQVVPGSHRLPGIPKPGERHPSERLAMEAGSALVLHGSTWHGGGENSTDAEHRYGLSIQYVAGWCRQQQNLMLGTPREVVETYPRRLQELIGYQLFRKVMGHVDRAHPLTLLGVDASVDMVWDRMGRDTPAEGD